LSGSPSNRHRIISERRLAITLTIHKSISANMDTLAAPVSLADSAWQPC
jgi:hypothetical protein